MWRDQSSDVAALVASVLIPLGMGGWPGIVGSLQRTVFLIAYVWYATACSSRRALLSTSHDHFEASGREASPASAVSVDSALRMTSGGQCIGQEREGPRRQVVSAELTQVGFAVGVE